MPNRKAPFELGRVETVRNQVCTVSALERPGLFTMVQISSGVTGVVFGYTEIDTEVVLLGDFQKVKRGDLVKPTQEPLSLPVSDQMLGRIISPIGLPIDDRGNLPAGKPEIIDRPARPMRERSFIDRPLQTGFLIIDSQIPLGLGQRELLLGEKKLGQSDLATAIISNQASVNSHLICILVAIGSQTAMLKRYVEQFQASNALARTIILFGRASDSAPLNFLAPMTGVTIAETFAAQGKDVLIVFDSLSRHAKAYRELSLLLNRTPGREAYPGDIFYLHSRLLERCGAFNKEAGGGSITALPIVETESEDITDYITTNLMSITDGHILFSQNLANQGINPAIDSGYSVTRIGSRAQLPPFRELSDELRQILIHYREMEKYAAFGTEMLEETAALIELGKRTNICLNQRANQRFTTTTELLLIYLVTTKKIMDWELNQISTVRDHLIDFCTHDPQASYLQKILSLPSTKAALPYLKKVLQVFLDDPATPKPMVRQEASPAEKETIFDLLNTNSLPK